MDQAEAEAHAMTGVGVPMLPWHIPFVDPGEAKRQAARDLLERARQQLDDAGEG